MPGVSSEDGITPFASICCDVRRSQLAPALVGIVLVAAATNACSGDQDSGPASPPARHSSPTSSEPAKNPTSTRLKPLRGPVSPLVGLPASFPKTIDRLEPLKAGEGDRFTLAYRPYESLRDGLGWASETIALFDRLGRWHRLNLGAIAGLDDAWWPGPDPTGPGWLDPTGSRLALRTDKGVAVIDLETLDVRRFAGGAGRTAGMRWSPGGRTLTVHSASNGRDFDVDTRSGTTSVARVPVYALGYLEDGRPCRIGSGHDGVARLTVIGGDRDPLALGQVRTREPTMFQSWATVSQIAFMSLGSEGGKHIMHVSTLSDGSPAGSLEWGTHTGEWFAMYGWIKSNRLLASISGSLFTWDPPTGRVVRVASLPAADRKSAHGSIGLSFAAALPWAGSSSDLPPERPGKPRHRVLISLDSI